MIDVRATREKKFWIFSLCLLQSRIAHNKLHPLLEEKKEKEFALLLQGGSYRVCNCLLEKVYQFVCAASSPSLPFAFVRDKKQTNT
jgi:hypothetical protein